MVSAKKNSREKKRRPQGITAITVEGFKSLCNKSRIEVRPLTILAGANSSGKSSIMQPLLLMKQTLEATYDPGPLLLDGPNVRFTSADQVVCKSIGKSCADRFMVEITTSPENKISLTFSKRSKKKADFEIKKMNVEGMALTPQMTHKQINSIIPDYLKKIMPSFANIINIEFEWSIQREYCFLTLAIRDVKKKSSTFHPFTIHDPFSRHVKNIIHVPGLRGNPERTYKTTSVGPTFPGTFENYVASIISDWQSKKKENGHQFNKLSAAMEKLGLTWKVQAKRLNATQVEIQVGRLHHSARGGASDLVSIADVGFGVSQFLPVLVALLVAMPDQLVYLEQPEIHLHPKAQYQVAQLLADAAKRGVRVVAETHSSLILLGIQTLVAEGKLSPELVKLHWFERDKDGITKISSTDLDSAGRFGDWPQDFDDVMLRADNQYLDAAERHR